MSIHWCIRKAREAQTAMGDWNLLEAGKLPGKWRLDPNVRARAPDLRPRTSDPTPRGPGKKCRPSSGLALFRLLISCHFRGGLCHAAAAPLEHQGSVISDLSESSGGGGHPKSTPRCLVAELRSSRPPRPPRAAVATRAFLKSEICCLTLLALRERAQVGRVSGGRRRSKANESQSAGRFPEDYELRPCRRGNERRAP
jgi:hypothetical protein